MRSKILLKLLFLFALISAMMLSGCYTQLAKPRVDQGDEYYIETETEQQPEEVYYEEQEYDQNQPEEAVVNNYYYNNYYYDPLFDPFYDPWFAWYVSYRYPYYGYFYSGFYPWYWWDPYYHPYYPGWYVGFYSGYYSSWWYWDSYWTGGSVYWTSREMKKRPFERRSMSDFQREARRNSRGGLNKVNRLSRTDNEAEKIINNKDLRRTAVNPGKKTTAPEGKQTLIKPRDEARPIGKKIETRTDRQRMTIVKPEGKIIIRRPAKGTIPANKRKQTSRPVTRPPKNDANRAVTKKPANSGKQSEAISKTKRTIPVAPKIQSRKKYSPPRIKKENKNKSYQPQLNRSKVNRYPTVKRSLPTQKAPTFTKPKTKIPGSYSRTSVNRTIPARGTVSRPSTPSKSSGSSSKSSGTKKKN